MDSYRDIVTKRQAILERLKSGEVKNFAGEIQKFEGLIRKTILGLDEEVSDLSRRKLTNLLKTLQSDQGRVFGEATKAFLGNSANIAAVYMAQEINDLVKTTNVNDTLLKPFTKKEIFSRVIARPLATDGDLLEPWLKKFTERETERVSNAVRLGHSQGLTNQQMVQTLIGTKAENYKNGILQATRRNASTVVRTSTQHVASAARQEVWESNPDVVKRYRFVATLDTVTSRVCRTLDNQEFEFGEGPIPPVHPNCRSTTIAVLDPKFKFLSKGRTRSGESGPVAADTDYYDWLKRQSAKDQREVLGETRYKLFKNGGLSAEKFRKLQFDKTFTPLTLQQMQKLEPEAFKKAGISVGATATATAKTTAKPKSKRPPLFDEFEKEGHVFGDVSYTEKVNFQPKIFRSDRSYHLNGKIYLDTQTGRYAPKNKTFQKVVCHEYGHAIHDQNEWVKWGQDPHPIVKKAFDDATEEVKKNKPFYLKLVGTDKGVKTRTDPSEKRFWDTVDKLAGEEKFKGLTRKEQTEALGGLADTLGAITNNLIGHGHSDYYYKKRNWMKKKYGNLAEFFAHAVENKHGYNPQFESLAPKLFKIMTKMIDDLYDL